MAAAGGDVLSFPSKSLKFRNRWILEIQHAKEKRVKILMCAQFFLFTYIYYIAVQQDP